MTDIEFLQSTQIHKLQTAARMAGLRWKNGDPAYNKEGVIRELQFRPSVLLATVANIQAMDRGQSALASRVDSSGLLDDIAAESGGPLPASVPLAAPIPAPGASVDLSAYVTRVSWSDGRQADDAQTRARIQNLSNETARGFDARDKSIEYLKAEIIELKKQAPAQMHFPDRPVIDIPPGQHEAFPRLIQYLQINRRVILTGSAGTGKSMAVKDAAKMLGVDFYLQTPVTMSHELIGHRDAQGEFHETPLFKAYTKGGLILMDESDASLPDALLVANPIFDGNGFAQFGDGNMHEQHPDFMAVFNMNTDGNGASMQYSGRNRLDGATLARFGVRIHWGIDARIEAGMALGCTSWLEAIRAVRSFMDARQIQDVNATPRHLKTGALLLTQGNIPRDTLLADVLKSGALSDAWADITRLPAVARFLRGE